jgi:chromosome segregation ATPase
MYRELRNQRFTTTLEDLVSAAQGEVESLGSELRDWHGNLPEGINSSDKASEIDEAASTLENINFPDVPEALGQIKVMHLPALEQDSRPKRSAEVVSMLDNAIDSLNSKADDLRQAIEGAKRSGGDATKEGEALEAGPATPAPEAASVDPNKEEESDPQEMIDEIESLVSELENVKGELDNVTYPSMM